MIMYLSAKLSIAFCIAGNVIGDHFNVAKEFFSSMEKSSILT